MSDQESLLDHPVAEGLAGFFAIMFALAGPLLGGYLVVKFGFVPQPLASYLFGASMVTVGVILFNRVLHATIVRDWIARFMQWTAARNLPSYHWGDGL
ncbi:MAG: hypothetical protein ACOCQY_02920 [Halorhabdus sp.]